MEGGMQAQTDTVRYINTVKTFGRRFTSRERQAKFTGVQKYKEFHKYS